MRKIVVTGGNGFIGSSLVNRLVSEGFEVHALVGRNSDRLKAMAPQATLHSLAGDVFAAAKIIREVAPDVIFHLATSTVEPERQEALKDLLEANIGLGSAMLLGASQCERRPILINAGSYWQFDSDGSIAPNSLYAATKQAFEDLLQYYRQRYQIPAVTLVLYDTFGKDDVRPKLWQRLITSSKGHELSLSPGEQIIHLVHIDDVVDAFLMAASLLSDGMLRSLRYTVHSSHPRRLRDVIERLDVDADLQLRLHWGGLPYPATQIMTPFVGEPLPGWSDRTDIAAALVQAALLRKNMAASFSREGKES